MPAVTVSGDGFVTGEASDIIATGSIIDVGSVANTIIFTPGAAFKADNYTITRNEGTLEITQDPSILLVKTADFTSVSAPGDVTYTYTITNTGDVPLTAVSVTDDKIVGTITPLLTELAPGQTTTATVVYVVKQEMIDAGLSIVNTAKVSGLAPDRVTVVEWVDSARQH